MLNEIEVPKYQIYCDLDGVITDFDGRYEYFVGMSPSQYDNELKQKYGNKVGTEKFWEKINPLGTVFWVEMDFMPDAMILWGFIEKHNPKFLSSPSRSETSVIGKQEWHQKHFPHIELILRQADLKQEFANENSILIDDRIKNINQWRDRGGIAIHHSSAEDTIKQLKELGYE